MRIKLEIHAPGLDLHHERWNHHVLFMDSLHAFPERVAAAAWRCYQNDDRCALFVDQDQWMTVIKSEKWTNEVLFPCNPLHPHSSEDMIDVSPLRKGFEEMISEYDPEREVVVLVEHHPGEQLSAYLIEPDVSPPEACKQMRESELV